MKSGISTRAKGRVMSIPEKCLQQILRDKDAVASASRVASHGYVEGWRIIDGAVVIYDCDDPPMWLPDTEWEAGRIQVGG